MAPVHLRGEDQLLIEQRILHGTTYRGVPSQKMPMDAWVYQEIIHEVRPQWVVEIGNRYGGSLLYLADLVAEAGGMGVIGVDINHGDVQPEVAAHPFVTLIEGDALAVFPLVHRILNAQEADGALVIEDSSHTFDHTLAVARLYSDLVPVGSYLIVEDGVMPPVADAIAAFLYENADWHADADREWPITWNPGGYLVRHA